MLLDPDLHDTIMKSIHTERIESYRPHFDETYEAFVKRACLEKLYPIKLSGECLDVRQEENAIVLYFFGEGSSRLYTYEESYTIPDPRSLRDKLITFYGICHKDCGQYAAVPTSIILRLPFDEAELLGS